MFDKCSNKAGHGHNYVLEVSIRGDIDNSSGMIYNHEEFKNIVDPLVEEFDYKWIDREIDYFRKNQSTVENIGKYIWARLKETFSERLSHIKIWENPRSYFEYYEES